MTVGIISVLIAFITLIIKTCTRFTWYTIGFENHAYLSEVEHFFGRIEANTSLSLVRVSPADVAENTNSGLKFPERMVYYNTMQNPLQVHHNIITFLL